MTEDLSKRLYVENLDRWRREINKKRFFDDELKVKVIEHGIILPSHRIEFGIFQGGVCDKDLNFVVGNLRKYDGGGGFNTIESAYDFDMKEVVELDEDVIFGGLLAEHFGHFFTESLCRLWYVIKNPELKSKILFVTTLKNGAHAKFTNKFLELIGIDLERVIYVGKPMQCRSITIPEQAQYGWSRISQEFFLPYQAIKSKIKAGKKYKKLYLSRLGFESKKHGNVHCFNEKYFEDFFVARGFKSISMEKLKVEEQISLIMGADEIAANLGTLTHWAIFCKPGTKFIMLNRTSNYVTEIQTTINKVFNVDWYIVDGSKNFLFADRTHGACLFGANKCWKAFVADYFGEQIEVDDDAQSLEEELDNYVDFWYDKYADEKEKITDSLKNICRRIITLDSQLNKTRPLLTYQAHVARNGWRDGWKSESQFSNPLDKQYDIQAIKINFTNPFHDVYYSVYYNEKEGWSSEVSTGQMAGTTGKSKSIMGIKIRLDETGTKEFDILYRVHKFDGEWTAWAKNGEELLSDGQKLNAIQICLKPKSEPLPSQR